MADITYTIRCEGNIVAKNVPGCYVCMLFQSIMTRFHRSAAAGNLKIAIEAEDHTMSLDE